ncbi:WD40 repeat-like protein [Rozella allomycis CSF55]|uniref:Elongator complex protein 2 n=1 Tax=Rozella allomycis (strain CSF55) TaxID=988480 RepID=A0A4P9YED7_ROZAC|nr:WD40 repeat-like protein [Rozella allomycis CSF55]
MIALFKPTVCSKKNQNRIQNREGFIERFLDTKNLLLKSVSYIKVNVYANLYSGTGKDVQTIGMVSGSADGQVIIWKRQGDSFKIVKILSDHSLTITGLSVLEDKLNHTVYYLATSSLDEAVFIYQFNEEFLNESENGKFELDSKLSLGTKYGMNETFQLLITLKGHENWIQGLSFGVFNEGGEANDLVLASSSQDKYIRLWRISSRNVAEAMDDDFKSLQLSTQAQLFELSLSTEKTMKYSVMVESVLYGHDDWVYSVQWLPPKAKEVNGKIEWIQENVLLSASSDKSLMLWKFDDESGVWNNFARVGEIGGNSFGFYNGMFEPNGNYILGQSYTGAFYLWSFDGQKLEAEPCITGNMDEVRRCEWNKELGYLVTVSKDQTTRIISECDSAWYEIARPQIHGYDMQCITFTNTFQFVSAGEEKVLRVFATPKSFIKTYCGLKGINEEEYKKLEGKTSFVGANVPALGLSNKAVSEINEKEEINSHSDNRFNNEFSMMRLEEINKAPLEHHLITGTLWPEIDKLYGHGFEVFSVASSNDGSLLASSCKSSTAEHAKIILWDTKTWKIISHLAGHSLTVTRIKFSPDDSHLVSVSRDRSICIFKRNGNDFNLIKTIQAHSRIIWDVDWFDNLNFITVSRDKKIKIWNLEKDLPSNVLELNDSVTCVSVAPVNNIFAVGLESGAIQLFIQRENRLEKYLEIDADYFHASSVTSIAWCLIDKRLKLASTGSDNSVRIFSIKYD